MPFVRKTDSQGSQPPTDARKLFIGRTDELLFFVQNILKPEEPSHNIISIWGQGGVGKSTLLSRFIDEAHSSDFKDYCLTAIVDELHTTPVSIMEKFATQLHMQGTFEKALRHYKEVLRTEQAEREMMQDTLVQKMPTFAGAALEGVPFVGPLLGEGVKATAEHLLDRRYNVQRHKDAVLLEDPVNALTQAFVDELNQLAETQVLLGSRRFKKRRLILFFDTFEQLAAEAAPWLLDCFLPADINGNIVLVIAGRDPIEHSTPGDPKRWLPYIDNGDVYWIPLNSFTEDEARAYLIKRDITDPERIMKIWQLSQGLPLYLSLLTSDPRGKVDPTADVVANFLRWIPEKERVKRQLALDAALFSRPFNQDDLAAFAYLTENDRSSLYDWLVGQPFVRPQNGRFSYHELARELFSRHLYQRSRKEYNDTRRALANYYQQLLEEIQMEQGKEAYHSAEWLELELALAHQFLLLPDKVSHVKAIEQVVKASKYTGSEQKGEIARVLRELSQEQPNNHANASAQQTAEQLSYFIESNLRSQEFLSAADFLLEGLIHKPSFPTELLALVYRNRGIAYYLLKEYQRALSDFNHALELDPNIDFIYNWRGWAYYYLKEYQRALNDFNCALELDPDHASAYEGRGWTYYYFKDYQRALSDFDRLAGLQAWGYLSRSSFHEKLKQYQQAIDDCNRFLELNPNDASAYNSRGAAYYWLKEYQRALSDFNHALELDPNSASIYNWRGWAYYRLKEYQQAITDFNFALELDPDHASAYEGRGWTYYYFKDYQRTIADFDRAIELEPHNAAIFARRGLTNLWMRNTRQAVIDYAHGWEIDSKYLHNGWMTIWSGMCHEIPDLEVIEQLEIIATANLENLVVFVCRGVAIWLRRNFDEALQELEQAIQIAPENWDPYFWKGMVYASLGQEEEAIAAVERSLELELPPILLTPLRWFEQDRPDFYQKYVVPLMARYDLV